MAEAVSESAAVPPKMIVMGTDLEVVYGAALELGARN